MPVRLRGIFLAGALLSCSVLHADGVLAGSAAVLPFTNISTSPPPGTSGDWIGESLAESLREALASRGVMAVSHDDISEAYGSLRLKSGVQLTHASILKLGQALGVEKIIHGTFRVETSGVLTIEASIIDRLRSRIGGQVRESGTLSEMDRAEAHLAWQVVRAIAPAAAPPESAAQLLRPPVRPAAEESFIRGWMSAVPEAKERFYQQAARSDPRFARPALELGKIELDRRNYKVAALWLAKIEPLDLHYPEASFYSGVAKFRDGDYVSAQGAFDRITKSLPTPEVYNNLGAAENRLNLSHAIVSFRQAIDMNPGNPDYQFNLGYALFKGSQFDAAADRFRAVLERDPTDQMAILLLGKSIKREGLRAGNLADARFAGAERLSDTYESPLPRPAAVVGVENK